ncbi:UNVERIFIED_CONTAM: hypothetical protein GTU68_044926 [Idotea baltica]|nr:hypothetical protein [Idotea baltica]
MLLQSIIKTSSCCSATSLKRERSCPAALRR